MLKNKYLSIHFFLGILTAITVPLSVFWINISPFITPLLGTLYIISFVICLKKGTEKLGQKIRLIFASMFILLIAVLGNYCNPYWNSINLKNNASFYSYTPDTMLTSKEAEKDLEYAMYYLKKLHPAFYSSVPEDVQVRYESVSEKIKGCEEISVCELSQDIEYIFSVMRDGHSYVKMNVQEPHYMKEIYRFNQGGYELRKVNGITVEELLKQTKDMYSYEVESWQLLNLKGDISSLEGLAYLGFSADDGITYTYKSINGDTEEVVCYPDDFLTYDQYYEYNDIETQITEETPFVYYSIDEDRNAAILTLNSCNYNDEYSSCLKDMFTEVKEKNIENIAVDLRSNGGGDSRVADEFIRYLNVEKWRSCGYEWRLGCFKIPFTENEVKNEKYTDLTFYGNTYILTSANSFSSAMLFSQYIKDNNLGVIIGEAPGNTPNGYGEISMFKLPNSQLYMQISTKEFLRADQNTSDRLVEPDIACDSDKAVDIFYKTIERN